MPASSSGPRRGGKVLLVECNEGLAFAIRCVLESDGYQVRTTAAGREVPARLDAERFDLILLGAALPDVRTRDLLHTVRAVGRGARVLVLGEHHAADAERARAGEAWLPHAYGVRDLLAGVRGVLAPAAGPARRAPA